MLLKQLKFLRVDTPVLLSPPRRSDIQVKWKFGKKKKKVHSTAINEYFAKWIVSAFWKLRREVRQKVYSLSAFKSHDHYAKISVSHDLPHSPSGWADTQVQKSLLERWYPAVTVPVFRWSAFPLVVLMTFRSCSKADLSPTPHVHFVPVKSDTWQEVFFKQYSWTETRTFTPNKN